MDKAIRASKAHLEIEVGSAQGHFLCDQAIQDSTRHFVGIEVNEGRHAKSVIRKSRFGVENVEFIFGDATKVLALVPDQSVSVLHVYFPTGRYWDTDGAVHPLFTKSFASTVYQKLRPFGAIRVLTDQFHEFVKAMRIFSGHGYWSVECLPSRSGLPPGYLCGSPLEMKYRPEHVIYAMQLVK